MCFWFVLGDLLLLCCRVWFAVGWIFFGIWCFLGFVIVLICVYEFVVVLTPCVFVGGIAIWGLGRFGFAFVVS